MAMTATYPHHGTRRPGTGTHIRSNLGCAWGGFSGWGANGHAVSGAVKGVPAKQQFLPTRPSIAHAVMTDQPWTAGQHSTGYSGAVTKALGYGQGIPAKQQFKPAPTKIATAVEAPSNLPRFSGYGQEPEWHKGFASHQALWLLGAGALGCCLLHWNLKR
jgi:hypothetical protein